METQLSGHPAGCLPPEEVDMLLQRCEGGVDAALQYAKNMAKYMKDLIGYLEKRTALGASWVLPGGGWWEGPGPCTHPCTPAPPRLQRWTSPKACRRLSTTADRASPRRWGPWGEAMQHGGRSGRVCRSPVEKGQRRGFLICTTSAKGPGEAAGLPRGLGELGRPS